MDGAAGNGWRERLSRGRDTQLTRWRDKLVRAAEQGAAQALDRRLQEAEDRAERRHQEVLEAMRLWERRQRRDVMTALEQEAARSSAELLRTEMAEARMLFSPQDTLRHGLAQAPADGLALEFGVATGETLAIIAQERGGSGVVGFDSFEGLPERWRLGYPAGEFATDTLPEVPGAELVVGWFDQVLPGWLADNPGTVAFLHIDCDLYSSTRTVLELLVSRLTVGTVVVFDEYYNYAGWQEHEYRAWQELVAATGLGYEHLALTLDDEQVAVRITSLPAVKPGPAPAAP